MARTIPPKVDESPTPTANTPPLPLTEKRERFCQEYLFDLNGTQAAIRAGYSPKCACVEASQLLALPRIRERIAELAEELKNKVDITPERVLKEIYCMAAWDPKDYVKIKKPEDIALLPEIARKAIIGWGYDKNGKFELKMAPRTPSQDQLGKYLKLFTEVKQLQGPGGAPLIPPNHKEIDPSKLSTADLEKLVLAEEGK